MSTVSNFLIALLLSHFMGARIKGDSTIFVTTITFLVFFCNIVGGQALVYLVPRFRMENLVIPAYIWSLMVAGVSFFLFYYFDVFTLRRSLNICLISILSSTVNINAAVLLAKQDIRRYNILTVLPVVITLIGLLIAIFVFGSDDIYGYLYPMYAGFTIAVILSFVYVRQHIHVSSPGTVFDDIDSSLKYGLGFQVFDLLQLLNFRFYFFLLYHIQGASDLGLFSIGVSILEVVWILGRSVSVIHYSDFSNHENQQMAVLKTLRYLKVVVPASALMLSMIALCPSDIYGMVFGSSFAEVKYLVKWLFPGVMMYSITLVIQGIYMSRARYGRLIFAQLVSLLLSVALCYLWIPHYFFSGASAAASVSYIVCSFIMLAFFIWDYQVSVSKLFISRADLFFINNILKSLLNKRKGF